MSFCIVGNFVSADLVISFCLDAIYWGGWAFVSLLANISDLSIKKQMFDRDTMLTSSKCFPGLPWPLSTDAKSAKGADIGDDWIGGADIGGICTRGICTKSTCIRRTYIRSSCIGDICLGGASIRVVCVGGAYTSDTCARDTCTGNVFSIVCACIKGVGPKGICGLAYKPSKSSIKGSRLLVESISEMPISFCLRLQVILDSFS